MRRSSAIAVLALLLVAASALAQGAGRWETRAPLPTPRSGYGVAAVRGRIFVGGGELGRPTTYPENEEFNPRTNTWTARALMPTPRHGLAAVAVDDRVFTISGGPRPGGTFSNTTEVYIPD